MIKMFLRKRRKKGNKNKSQSSLGPLKELSVVTWRVSITKRWESKSKKSAIFKNKVVWKQQYLCCRWTTSRNERNASVYVWWRKISLAGIFFPVTTPGSPLLDPPIPHLNPCSRSAEFSANERTCILSRDDRRTQPEAFRSQPGWVCCNFYFVCALYSCAREPLFLVNVIKGWEQSAAQGDWDKKVSAGCRRPELYWPPRPFLPLKHQPRHPVNGFPWSFRLSDIF